MRKSPGVKDHWFWAIARQRCIDNQLTLGDYQLKAAGFMPDPPSQPSLFLGQRPGVLNRAVLLVHPGPAALPEIEGTESRVVSAYVSAQRFAHEA